MQRKNKIYVIEGQDRCGKSSFIDFLRNRITNPKLLVMHSSKPPKGIEDVRLWATRHYFSLGSTISKLWADGYDIILDRSWIGEYVYAPLYRGMNPEDEWMFDLEANVILHNRDLDGWYKTKQFPSYDTPSVCLAIFSDIPSNLAIRNDGNNISSKLEDLQLERDRFLSAFNKTNIKNKILVDWSETDFSPETFTNIVEKFNEYSE